MQPAKTLLRIQHGSHLYGTNTPTSDLDYKGVFLPAGRDILLQRVPKVIDKGTGSQHEKNTSDDVDDQAFPLQKFLQMVTSGDTVGTELLFAPDFAIVEMHPDWEMIRESKHLLLNKQCKGFVGYCQRQAAKYGIKGSRMAACKGIYELLQEALAKHGTSVKLVEIADELGEFCATHDFAEIVNIPSQAGRELLHLDVVDRKVPFTNTIKAAYDIFRKVYDNYGHRTRAAMDNEGIDWKAVSHAIRVAGQAKELLLTGHITFPRPDAAFLLQVKRGELDYNDVAPTLERMVEEVDEASRASSLPGKSDNEAIDELVLQLHHYQIADAV
jgi:hypothetical protein